MKNMKSLKIICVLILVTCLTCFAFAKEVKRVAKIINITGDANVKLHGETAWIPAKEGMILNEGDMIRTESDSWALLSLNGESQTANVEVEENSKLLLSELVMEEEKGTQRTLLDLAIGQILIKAEKLDTPDSKFEVKTPTSIVGVRGTRFSVRVEALK